MDIFGGLYSSTKLASNSPSFIKTEIVKKKIQQDQIIICGSLAVSLKPFGSLFVEAQLEPRLMIMLFFICIITFVLFKLPVFWKKKIFCRNTVALHCVLVSVHSKVHQLYVYIYIYSIFSGFLPV